MAILQMSKMRLVVIDYYKDQGALKVLNAEGSIEEVWNRLQEVIK